MVVVVCGLANVASHGGALRKRFPSWSWCLQKEGHEHQIDKSTAVAHYQLLAESTSWRKVVSQRSPVGLRGGLCLVDYPPGASQKSAE